MSLNRFCLFRFQLNKILRCRAVSLAVRAPSLTKSRFFQLRRHQHIASIRSGKTASQHYAGVVQI
jgi:hypothetical protein